MNYAILIGINKYPRSPLRGCVNDVNNVVFLCGKAKKDYKVMLLTDEKATKKSIMLAFENTLKVLKDGDSLLIWFSGHGVQMPTINDNNEIDGLDEAICPIDFAWTNETAIRDNELSDFFSRIPKGVEIVFVSDSCHSGDLQRAMTANMETTAKRMLPENQPFHASILNHELKVKNLEKSIRQRNLLFISGCKSDQTSADAVFDGIPNGALTYFLLKSLSAYPNNTPITTIMFDVKRRLKQSGFSQIPTITATTSRLKKPLI